MKVQKYFNICLLNETMTYAYINTWKILFYVQTSKNLKNASQYHNDEIKNQFQSK